ncbi:MAG: hypothetical protein BWX58_01337 [Deltaproteobacteria bacterium ADurb.Bin026]|nr:MAG: hypothetical protein BWX58_01337 [Deltaproteobacteria bacterium ADurb.Bin026]
MECYRKIVTGWIKFDLPITYQFLKYRQRTLSGNIQLSRKNSVCYNYHCLMGVAAFTYIYLLHLQLSCDLSVFNGNPCKLNIVIPDPIINCIIAYKVACEGPVYTCCIKDYSKCLCIFWPGDKFPCIMDQ